MYPYTCIRVAYLRKTIYEIIEWWNLYHNQIEQKWNKDVRLNSLRFWLFRSFTGVKFTHLNIYVMFSKHPVMFFILSCLLKWVSFGAEGVNKISKISRIYCIVNKSTHQEHGWGGGGLYSQSNVEGGDTLQRTRLFRAEDSLEPLIVAFHDELLIVIVVICMLLNTKINMHNFKHTFP